MMEELQNAGEETAAFSQKAVDQKQKKYENISE